MLLRLGRIVYLFIFALLILVWTETRNDDTKEMVYKGWNMTAHAFDQGSSFAIDDAVVSDAEKARPHVDKSLGIAQKQRMNPLKVRVAGANETSTCQTLHNIHELTANDRHHLHHTLTSSTPPKTPTPVPYSSTSINSKTSTKHPTVFLSS